MNAIYVTEQGASIRQESRHLVVTKEKKRIATIPLVNTERLLLFGNIQLTTQAMNVLAQEGVDVSFLTSTGRLRFKLVCPESKNIVLRIAQYERSTDSDFQLNIARSIVKGKISNARYMILRYNRNYPEIAFDDELKTIEQQLHNTENAGTVDSLMGIEGISTAVYFKAFGRMFRKEFTFEKRTRRPPKDPVNAVLSFGYTLITNEIHSLLDAHGFDPYMGYLHGTVYGRPSLALDLVEEFRHPYIDRFALSLFNNEMLKPDDFRKVEGQGIYLTDLGMKTLLKNYEARMRESFTLKTSEVKTTYREIILKQIQQLASAIKHRKPYEPYSPGD